MKIGVKVSKKDTNLVYIEIKNNKGITFSVDEMIALFLGVSEEQYLERMKKIFKDSFIFKRSTLGWYIDKRINNLSLEDIINKFEEEFLIELTTKILA